MARLVVKTGVEPFTRMEEIDVFIDDVKDGWVYIKISRPDFQQILEMSERDFELLMEEYRRFKNEKV